MENSVRRGEPGRLQWREGRWEEGEAGSLTIIVCSITKRQPELWFSNLQLKKTLHTHCREGAITLSPSLSHLFYFVSPKKWLVENITLCRAKVSDQTSLPCMWERGSEGAKQKGGSLTEERPPPSFTVAIPLWRTSRT